MRLLSFLFISLALSSVAAQDNFCVKYAKIVFGKTAQTLTGFDEFNLINAVVGRVVVGCDDTPATQYGIPGVNATVPPFGAYAKAACNKVPTNPPTVVKGLVADPLNAPFFAGSAPNYNSITGLQDLNTAAGIGLAPSIRFVNVTGFNVAANPATTGAKGTEGLIFHLVSFFGRDLGCSFFNANQATPANFSFIGRYQGTDNLAGVHKNMNITKDVWNEFVKTFSDTLTSFGVTQDDIAKVVVPYVQTFLLQPPTGGLNPQKQICNQPSCDCIPGYTNTNGVCIANAATNPPTNPPKGQASMITMNPIVAIATIGLLLIASLL